jgi:hypothetical protein
MSSGAAGVVVVGSGWVVAGEAVGGDQLGMTSSWANSPHSP